MKFPKVPSRDKWFDIPSLVKAIHEQGGVGNQTAQQIGNSVLIMRRAPIGTLTLNDWQTIFRDDELCLVMAFFYYTDQKTIATADPSATIFQAGTRPSSTPSDHDKTIGAPGQNTLSDKFVVK